MNYFELNYKKLSESAVKLLKSKVGYRRDDFYGSNVIDFIDVVRYEMLELGNEDIPVTISSLYGIDVMDVNIYESFSGIIDFIFKAFNINKKNYKQNMIKARWFCSDVDHVVDNYILYCESEIYVSKYSIPNDIIIASDLDRQGILVVSNKEFVLLEDIFVEIER